MPSFGPPNHRLVCLAKHRLLGGGRGVAGQDTDPRSGIANDPNNLEDEQYIVRLIGQMVTVSLEMVEIVKSLPGLEVG